MTTLQDAEHGTNNSGEDVYVVRHAAGDETTNKREAIP